ncbi:MULTISPECIES: penicillin-binding protein 1A [unclassified Herbaspirillum]|uniref:penicillin-binding protein 1A n=1 Tax=unclassified Herbaspirillum TaxID=2624150 RepID=UPI00114DE86B|nr:MULTISPECIES: penicillin-binding protein 1A [unclassified Herbaspirillum]MBB5391776.1 penicillin-binding protein 1A [Herbaspirillum sp. SJZ102]TQK02980.1 penicillin-binding protein 1A [Herbaspirillum sp. SJZ130]TQK06632.1 penicillin-binding protein 1A [Herbaspirillum sp. SJZ106]
MPLPTSPGRLQRQRGFLNPNIAKFIGLSILGLGIAGALLVVYALIFINPRLPSLDLITDYRPKVPLRIYSEDKVLLGEFGEEKRSLVKLDDIPADMKNAVLAIEDYRFYQHGGIDYIGIARALVTDVLRGSASQGASTITMQVARNVFLTKEKTFSRKLYEVLLANKIENALTKDQILEVYMNQIYLGQRAFGFAAAARTYFGKDLKDVTLAEAAMLAGLPKAPSAYNPIVNPKRAHIRQQYILQRMLDVGFITQAQYDAASKEELKVRTPGSQYNTHAEYVNEMVRQMVYAQYKEDTYTQGFNVYTTINAADQQAAYLAVRKGVMDYDRRHGYRGPEETVALPANADERASAIDDVLDDHPDNDDILAAVVVAAGPKQVDAVLRSGDKVSIKGDALRFVANALSDKAKKEVRIQPGSLIRVMQDAKQNWQIVQLPQVEAALVSVVPQDGAIRALIGGFDFTQNNFNHVTQAWRQPGSTFKPFIYSAALEKGFAPASIVNDAPVSYPAGPGQPNWEPRDDEPPAGPMSVRTALQKSVNLVAIRTLDYIGVPYAKDFITGAYGFDSDKVPPYLPMALGAGQTTPLQLSAAYSVFANGGYKIQPYLITQITDSRGKVLSKADPLVVGNGAPRVVAERNSYMMTSLLKSVAQRGTGARSNSLGRADLAGKTGTTNEAIDGWFAGYQRTLATVVWMGYDQPKSLGGMEFGAQLALPIWVDYMGKALKGVPQFDQPVPDGIRFIDGEPYYDNFTPENGLVTNVGVTVVDAISNFFGWTPSQAPAPGTQSAPNAPNAPGTPQAPPPSRGAPANNFDSKLYQGH